MEINFNELFHVKSGGDKIAHFIVGFVIGLLSVYFIHGSILMIVPVIAVAVGKELYDKFIKKTYFDFFDMFATLLGGVVGIMLLGGLIMPYIG